MFPNEYDDGYEFFNGDIQQQYFNYYAYTQITDDDPFGMFDDEPPKHSSRGGYDRVPTYTAAGRAKPNTQSREMQNISESLIRAAIVLCAVMLFIMFAAVLV